MAATIMLKENEAGELMPSLNDIETLYVPISEIVGLIVYTFALYVTKEGNVVVRVIVSESASL